MDYEKKNKDAISTIKKALRQLAMNGVPVGNMIEAIKDIEEKYAESEDERIRKELMSLFQDGIDCVNHRYDGSDCRRWLAWLEKQGETFTKKDVDDAYLKGICDAKHELEKQGEQKPITNVPSREVILAIWELGNEWKELTNGRISTEYGSQLDYIQKHWQESDYYLRTKQGEQKPAWSEEDKKMVRFIGNAITADGASEYLKSKGIYVIDAHVWLEELKERVQPQSHWKPSEEQMVVLNDIIINGHLSNANERILKGLQKQLKKLREE